jgi:hypothetical protein
MPVTEICQDFRSYLPALRAYAPGEINQLQALLDDFEPAQTESAATDTRPSADQRMDAIPLMPRPTGGPKTPPLTLEERLARLDFLSERKRIAELIQLANLAGSTGQIATGRGFLQRIPNRYIRRLALDSFNERFADAPQRTARRRTPQLNGPLPVTESIRQQVDRLIQQARTEVKNGRAEIAAGFLFAALERSGGRVPKNAIHLKQLNAITSLYLTVDPLVAIDLLGNIITKMQDSYEALAVLDGFVTESQQGQILYPENEFPLTEKLSLDTFYQPLPLMLADLAEKRFSQTALLIERVRRPELRLRLRIQVLDAMRTKK